jgi:hypothetical protein
VLLHVPADGTLEVSGNVITRLVDGADIPQHGLVRVVYLGIRNLGGGKRQKDFELYVTAEEAVLPEDLVPDVRVDQVS